MARWSLVRLYGNTRRPSPHAQSPLPRPSINLTVVTACRVHGYTPSRLKPKLCDPGKLQRIDFEFRILNVGHTFRLRMHRLR